MIDVVITWVDGEDPLHVNKRNQYLTGKQEDLRDDIAGHERFDYSGEIFFCVGSIFRFAPFVRKIFIVTDAQMPPVFDFVRENFPDSRIEIEVVDHRTIFKGYEQYLPTFSSCSIETMLWRIPGLSERFVYFNDDVFLAAPVQPSDWFIDDKVVCYGSKVRCMGVTVLSGLRNFLKGYRQIGFKDTLADAARAISSKHFFLFGHSPHAQLRSVMEDFYGKDDSLLIRNISYRFRGEGQFNPQELCYLLAERCNRLKTLPYKGKVLFLKPKDERENYLKYRLYRAEKSGRIKFGCINSLSMAAKEDKEYFRKWISDKLDIRL